MEKIRAFLPKQKNDRHLGGQSFYWLAEGVIYDAYRELMDGTAPMGMRIQAWNFFFNPRPQYEDMRRLWFGYMRFGREEFINNLKKKLLGDAEPPKTQAQLEDLLTVLKFTADNYFDKEDDADPKLPRRCRAIVTPEKREARRVAAATRRAEMTPEEQKEENEKSRQRQKKRWNRLTREEKDGLNEDRRKKRAAMTKKEKKELYAKIYARKKSKLDGMPPEEQDKHRKKKSEEARVCRAKKTREEKDEINRKRREKYAADKLKAAEKAVETPAATLPAPTEQIVIVNIPVIVSQIYQRAK